MGKYKNKKQAEKNMIRKDEEWAMGQTHLGWDLDIRKVVSMPRTC